MFADRADAGRRLAELLQGRALRQPLVLGIPRGGLVVGAAVAGALGAELDVVLSRKLRAPNQPELALGAIAEDGTLHLTHHAHALDDELQDYIEQERRFQLAEIHRRVGLFRAVRPRAEIRGRSVIVVDDGIATGSTMLAALSAARAEEPAELIAAAPVAAAEHIASLREWCDDVVCVKAATDFHAIGQFYRDFRQVDDDDVIALLREFAPQPR